MSFKRPKKPVQFAHLKQTLSTADPDSALYQTIQALIEKLTQYQNETQKQIDDTNSTVTTISGGGGGGGGTSGGGNTTATYHTKDDEIADLPNSVQLLAGTNISFDDTVPNKRVISSTGGGSGGFSHYDCPLSDGDLVAADLIFADGECIIVQVPV